MLTSTILEVGDYVTVPYAGKILSDLGADVVKLEPPEGDIARRIAPFDNEDPDPNASGFFGYLNTGKRSAVLPENEVLAGEIIDDLVAEYEIDVVIESKLHEYGLDPRSLADDHDSLSVVSVSGFGATGPWQEYAAPDIVAWAESGHMNKMGYPDSPPVRPRIKMADYWASQVAVIGAFASLLYRDVQGGSGQYVDVSKREAGVSTMDRFIAGYSWSGETTERTGSGYAHQGPSKGFPTILEAKDGYVSASPQTGDFETFVEEAFEDPGRILEDPRFTTSADRLANREELSEYIEEYTRTREKWDLFEYFQSLGIPSSVTATPEDVIDFEHLQARDFWQDVSLPNGEMVTMPGFPFRPDGPGRSVEMERAPRLGEHSEKIYRDLEYDPATLLTGSSLTSASRPDSGTYRSTSTSRSSEEPAERPLDGIRVIDFSWVYAGPHATKLLAGLGADVVKVESKQKPDSARTTASYDFDPEPTGSTSAAYNERNQGKRSLRLDLTSDRGQEVALDLMSEADIVLENYSPTFMDRVGLDYESVRDVNQKIVYLSISGWGKTGPAKDYRAYGSTIESMAGMDWISGFRDDPPTTAGFSLPDPTAGYMAVIAAQWGLYRREETDRGTYIELPLLEIVASLLHKPLMEYLMNGRLAERTGVRDEDYRFVQGVFPCRGEDNWTVIAIGGDTQWERFCDLLDRPDLVTGERFASHYARLKHQDEIREITSEWTSQRTREEVRHLLQQRGIPAGIVADEEDLLEHDMQLRSRDYFSSQTHPEVGERRFQGVPFSMERTDIGFDSRAPFFGEHTEEVLEEWLGWSMEKIEAAREKNALY